MRRNDREGGWRCWEVPVETTALMVFLHIGGSGGWPRCCCSWVLPLPSVMLASLWRRVLLGRCWSRKALLHGERAVAARWRKRAALVDEEGTSTVGCWVEIYEMAEELWLASRGRPWLRGAGAGAEGKVGRDRREREISAERMRRSSDGCWRLWEEKKVVKRAAAVFLFF